MVFSSTVFLFFFLPIILIVYHLSQNITYRNIILLLGSLAFYAWGEPLFVFAMILSVCINWFVAIRMDKSIHHRKSWLTVGIVYDILLIGIFKCLSFLSKNLAWITNNDNLVINIALPIGISFFTFQLMSYLFDIYYKKASVQKNPIHVGLYISLFPQLIAGPIVRYEDIAKSISHRTSSFETISAGMRRFIYGLGKKVLLANFLAQIADNVFDYTATPSVMTAWLGAFAYTLQIYFDFSGYSDMAIGLGMMFGFKFNENFNYPYIAKSITDFWRRWHISLSSWFRDYVYIPLGGNRVKRSRWILNMLAVWMLTGIWHGANWTFVLWGLIYFAVLVFEKLTKCTKKMGLFSHVYTLLIVILAWIFFRSSDIGAGCRYIGQMFGIHSNGFIDNTFISSIQGTFVVLICAIIGTTPIISKIFKYLKDKNHAWVESIWLLVIFILSVINVVSSTYNPFIYFNF